MKLISFVYMAVFLTFFPFIIQAKSSCSYPIKDILNQSIKPEQALEYYYKDRQRGLLYGHEKPLKAAIQYYREEKEDKEKEFQSLIAISDYYILIKEERKARHKLFEANELAEDRNNAHWQAIALMNLANLELRLDKSVRIFDPINIYQKALEFAKPVTRASLLEVQINVNLLQAKFLLYKESIANKHRSFHISKTEFQQVLDKAKLFLDISKNYKSEIAKQFVKLGFLAINYPNIEIQKLGEKALISAKEMDISPEDNTYAYIYGYLGEYYLKQKKTNQDAEPYLQEAIFFSRQQKTPVTLMYYWYWQLAKLYTEQGDIKQAKQFYKIAVEYFKSVRRAIFTTFPAFYSSNILNKDSNLFKEYANLLLKQAEQFEEGEEKQQLLLSALNVIEQLKAVKLQNHFEDECIADLSKEIKADKLPEILSSSVSAFYPIIFDDRIVLLLARVKNINGQNQLYLTQDIVSTDDISRILKEVNEKFFVKTPENKYELKNPKPFIETVDALLEQYIKMVKGTDGSFDLKSRTVMFEFIGKYIPVNKALHQLLIEPISKKLSHTHTLIIIPTGKLSTIPFSGLHNGDEEELIRKYALVSAVNLSLIEATKLPNIGKPFLFAGLSKKVRGYQPLIGVEQLLENLKHNHFYGMDEKTIFNETFIYNNLSEILDKEKKHHFEIIHISTHGEFGSTLSSRFLVGFQDNIFMNNLEALLGNKIRKQPLNLLVLSACNTATGDDNAVLGLAGVAIKARASSVLGSLWAVKTDTTRELMESFYSKLLNPKAKSSKNIPIDSKAAAWQEAQIKYLDNHPLVYRHPYYWAGFILIGSK